MTKARKQKKDGKPSGTKVKLFKSRYSIYVVRRHKRWTFGLLYVIALFTISLCIAGLMVILCLHLLYKNGVSGVLIVLYWSFYSTVKCSDVLLLLLKDPCVWQVLHIGPQNYGVWEEFIFREKSICGYFHENPGRAQSLGETSRLVPGTIIPARTISDSKRMKTLPACIAIKEGNRSYTFGAGLSSFELRWILGKINNVIFCVKKRDSSEVGKLGPGMSGRM